MRFCRGVVRREHCGFVAPRPIAHTKAAADAARGRVEEGDVRARGEVAQSEGLVPRYMRDSREIYAR